MQRHCPKIRQDLLDGLYKPLPGRLAWVLDAGPLPGGSGSTVVDVTTNPPTVLREGAVSETEIFRTLGQRDGKPIDIGP